MNLRLSIKIGLISALVPFIVSAETYKVKKGDTLEKIAKKYKVSVEELKAENNIKDEKFLREGMTIKIPKKGEKQASKEKKHKHSYTSEETYIVKKGDTLEIIAKKYGLTVKEIMDYNNMKDEKIFAGDELKIPVKGYAKKSKENTTEIDTSKCEVYTLKRGGTLKHVSKRTGVDVSILEKLNDIPSNQWLKAGTKICIAPKREEKKEEEKVSSTTSSSNFDNCTLIYNPPHKISLHEIARKFRTSTEKIRRINGLSSKVKYVEAGQKLCIFKEDKAVTKITEEEKTSPSVSEEKPVKKEVPLPSKTEPKTADADNLSVKLAWPVDGQVVANFQNDEQVRHLGIDIQTSCGNPVKAAEDGKVIYTGDNIKAFGNLVVIRHSNGLTTVYGYLDNVNVKEGKYVSRGEVIGTAGRLKNSDKCGIYFEVRKNVTPLDPLSVLE
ncbi:LysM peptidoglycan-binding domain-containing protein [Sulfurihydrogenibium sp.]|uniref:LysM peptidoglycan-binding domain-containing protein n=1 Tax=Sulfurihydrogenibium sp. TaxID=2053621 RepID=UPI003D0EEFE5